MTPRLPFGRAPEPPAERVAFLLALLDGRGWQSAKALARQMDTDDRTIRAIAAASDGAVISGQRGYCLTAQASVRDVQHAASWLRHQAQQMTKRAYQIERAMHQRGAA